MGVEDQYRELLRRAYDTTPACLSDDDLAMSAATSMAELPENVRVHLEGCPRCKAELSLLQSFVSAEGTDEEKAHAASISSVVERRLARSVSTQEPQSSRTRWLTVNTLSRWALAAALLIGITTLSLYRLQSTRENLDLGEGDGADVHRSGVVQLLAPRGDIARGPESFSWNAFPGAVHYQVTVMEVDKNVLWKQVTPETKISAPEDLRAKALPGKTLLWQVVAIGADGRPIAQSETWRIRRMVR